MKTLDKINWYLDTVWIKSMLTMRALNRLQFRKAAQVLAREDGQGTMEYVLMLAGAALVIAAVYGIFTSIRNRAVRTQQAIDALPSP